MYIHAIFYMFVYIYIYICIYIYVYMYKYVYVCMSIYMHIYKYIHMYIYIHACTHTCTPSHTCTHVTQTHTFAHAYTYTQSHIYKKNTRWKYNQIQNKIHVKFEKIAHSAHIRNVLLSSISQFLLICLSVCLYHCVRLRLCLCLEAQKASEWCARDQAQVAAFKEWSVATTHRLVLCPFC